MANSTLANEIRQAFPGLALREDEPMRAHTSFRIGGPADIFVSPDSIEQVQALRSFLVEQRGVEPLVIGNGSNLLVRDEGIRGVVLHMGEAMSAIRRDGDCLAAQAGVTLAHLAVFAKEQGLAGLEFAHGIPGSLGGAVMMNAGAYGGEMADVVTAVTCLGADGVTETSDLGFGYRMSRFERTGELILEAKLQLRPDDPAAIHERMLELWHKRSASQPLEKPSAGSTFKRPATGYAAAMIDQAGLKGLTVGGAQVSQKHAGFIINTGDATCADVLALMARVTAAVEQKFGVTLEPEVRVIGG